MDMDGTYNNIFEKLLKIIPDNSAKTAVIGVVIEVRENQKETGYLEICGSSHRS